MGDWERRRLERVTDEMARYLWSSGRDDLACPVGPGEGWREALGCMVVVWQMEAVVDVSGGMRARGMAGKERA